MFFPDNQDYDENLSSAMLTRLKTEMLVRQESIINQVSQRGVPSNSLVISKAHGGDGVCYVSDVDFDGVGEAGFDERGALQQPGQCQDVSC